MDFRTDVVIPKTVEDYAVSRDQVVGMVRGYYKAVEITKQAMNEILKYGLPYQSTPHLGVDEAIKQIDQTFWRVAFEKTGFMQIFDADSRKKFDDEIRSKTPEFNMANIRTTFFDLSQKADEMFVDGIVNVFRRLSGRYQSNDVFKIAEKIVLTGYVQPGWYSGGKEFRHGYAEDAMNDIDRVFKTLDGKKHNPRELTCSMNESFKKNEHYDDDYFHAKAYKNSNLHLTFKRVDLLEKANLIIAKHYGGNAISKERR